MKDELFLSFKGLRDIFWPRRCCVCDTLLDADQQDICPECFADLPLTYFWDWEQNPAYEKINGRTPVRAAACLFHFRREARYNHIMHSIKYYGNVLLGFRLGYMLGVRLSQSPLYRDIDAVTPVPLHPLRKFRRGYNQASVIAQGIAMSMHLPLEESLLIRRRYTKSQATLASAEKSGNVAGAFRLRRSKAQCLAERGVKHILLVDDTLTTGATLAECAASLHENFEVSVAALAYAG